MTQASAKAFAHSLDQLGWVEGKNIRIDYRFAAGDPALYNAYAAELAASSLDVLLAGNTPAVEALRRQTRTTPIVFVLVSYPVELGFVQGLARPGGNVTGFSAYDAPIMGKWVQLLKEIAPSVTRVAVIFNPGAAPFATFSTARLRPRLRPLGSQCRLLRCTTTPRSKKSSPPWRASRVAA